MKTIKRIANLVFWLSIISLPVSYSICCKVGEVDFFSTGGMVRYSWIMYLFVLIPIVSCILGLILKHNGEKYKKNIIVACITIPLLLIFGSFYGVYDDMVDYGNASVIAVEEKTGVHLPEIEKMSTDRYTEYVVSYARLTDESAVEFENGLPSSQVWTSKLGSNLENALPDPIQWELNRFDYFLFFNCTTSQFNIFPVDNGDYDCVFIAYDCERDRMLIVNNYIVSVY